TIRNTPIAIADNLTFKWKGQATTLADFGEAKGTGYTLCLYQGTGATSLKGTVGAPADGTCKNVDCWKKTTKAFSYTDSDTTRSPVRTIKAKPGAAGKASIVLKAKGAKLLLPAMPFQPGTVRAQLVTSHGTCWDASFTPTTNRSDRFTANSQ